MVTFIKSIVESLSPSVTFAEGEESWVNLISDNSVLPAIYLYHPLASEDALTSAGTVKEYYKLMFLICDKDTLDSTPTEMTAIIKRMRLLKNKLIISLSNNENVKDIKNIITNDVEKEFDAVLTGVVTNFSIELFNTDSIC